MPGFFRLGRRAVGVGLPIGLALAVDHAWAAEGYVVRIPREDEVMAVGVAQQGRTGVVGVVADVGTAKKHAAGLDIERYAAFKLDAAGEVDSRRRIDEASASLKHIVDGALNRRGVQRLAAGCGSVVQYALGRLHWRARSNAGCGHAHGQR